MAKNTMVDALRTAQRLLREERYIFLDNCCVKDKAGKPILSTMDGHEARHVKRIDFALNKIKLALRAKAP